MSQRAVDRVVGRLVTDEAFREAFVSDARSALLPYAIDLTREELDALRRVPGTALAALSALLDDRICRLKVPAEGTQP